MWRGRDDERRDLGARQARGGGLLTQWGTRLSVDRLRKPDGMTLLEQRAIPAVWRRSIREAIDVIDLLGITLASEIGDVSRFSSPRKLIGYAGLSPKINQSGDRSRTGALSKAGSRTLRWAAVEAAQHAWRETNSWHRLYTDLAGRAGKNPAKAAVARKILIASWHILSRQQPFKPPQRVADPTVVSASSRCFLAA